MDKRTPGSTPPTTTPPTESNMTSLPLGRSTSETAAPTQRRWGKSGSSSQGSSGSWRDRAEQPPRSLSTQPSRSDKGPWRRTGSEPTSDRQSPVTPPVLNERITNAVLSLEAISDPSQKFTAGALNAWNEKYKDVSLVGDAKPRDLQQYVKSLGEISQQRKGLTYDDSASVGAIVTSRLDTWAEAMHAHLNAGKELSGTDIAVSFRALGRIGQLPTKPETCFETLCIMATPRMRLEQFKSGLQPGHIAQVLSGVAELSKSAPLNLKTDNTLTKLISQTAQSSHDLIVKRETSKKEFMFQEGDFFLLRGAAITLLGNDAVQSNGPLYNTLADLGNALDVRIPPRRRAPLNSWRPVSFDEGKGKEQQAQLEPVSDSDIQWLARQRGGDQRPHETLPPLTPPDRKDSTSPTPPPSLHSAPAQGVFRPTLSPIIGSPADAPVRKGGRRPPPLNLSALEKSASDSTDFGHSPIPPASPSTLPPSQPPEVRVRDSQPSTPQPITQPPSPKSATWAERTPPGSPRDTSPGRS